MVPEPKDSEDQLSRGKGLDEGFGLYGVPDSGSGTGTMPVCLRAYRLPVNSGRQLPSEIDKYHNSDPGDICTAFLTFTLSLLRHVISSDVWLFGGKRGV